MIAMPIWLSMVWLRLLVNSIGATSNTSANRVHTTSLERDAAPAPPAFCPVFIGQPSREPSRPLGLKISISTSSR